jgi:drug/metabolite transporter (DMT)-like permease
MGMIKLQHGFILGYSGPVSASIYALLLGHGISVWTIAGVLIVVAGPLVVLLDEYQEEGATSLEPAP